MNKPTVICRLYVIVLFCPIGLPTACQAQAARGRAPDSLTAGVTPQTAFDGPALELDFPAVHIGVAEYAEGPTGVTVFYFPKNVKGAVDVRGGAPGTMLTDMMRQGYEQPWFSGVCFAGGSAYGLAAVAGVSRAIQAQRARTGGGGLREVATVPGAVIFDLGERRYSTVTPDSRLGHAALQTARPGRFPLGAHGAGRFAMQGSYFGAAQYSGQGGAFQQVGPTKIAVFTVVNSVGAVVDREGRLVRPGRLMDSAAETIAERIAEKTESLKSRLDESSDQSAESDGLTHNTTITLVVTNQKLPYWALQRLAVQVHTSMSRAIQPFHTERDGDTLFAVTTGEVRDRGLSAMDLGLIAGEVAWDAVLASVPAPDTESESEHGSVQLDHDTLDAYSGRYRFAPDANATVRRDGGRLGIEATDRGSLYLPIGRAVNLSPVSPTDFIMENARGDRLRFVRDAGGSVTGLVINPGNWPIPARRIR